MQQTSPEERPRKLMRLSPEYSHRRPRAAPWQGAGCGCVCGSGARLGRNAGGAARQGGARGGGNSGAPVGDCSGGDCFRRSKRMTELEWRLIKTLQRIVTHVRPHRWTGDRCGASSLSSHHSRRRTASPTKISLPAMILSRFAVVLATFSWAGVHALDNGLARTPPMGWMAWERFRCIVDCDSDPNNCVGESLLRAHIDILAQSDWAKAGYNRVNIDDW